MATSPQTSKSVGVQFTSEELAVTATADLQGMLAIVVRVKDASTGYPVLGLQPGNFKVFLCNDENNFQFVNIPVQTNSQEVVNLQFPNPDFPNPLFPGTYLLNFYDPMGAIDPHPLSHYSDLRYWLFVVTVHLLDQTRGITRVGQATCSQAVNQVI
jgi:hypothetical protein